MGFIRKLGLGLCVGSLMVASCSYAMADNAITVYSVSQLSLVNVPKGVTVCNLNGKRSVQMPFTKGVTHAEVQSWVHDHQSQLNAWAANTVCRYQASFLNLKYLPAVVMNNRYVVYGNTDIKSAIYSINQYREKHNSKGEQA